MKKRIIAFVVFAFIILIPATFASTYSNWDLAVSNGTLFCDSTSKSSIQAETLPYASSSSYYMSLYSPRSDSLSLTHSLSTEDTNLDSNTVLTSESASPNKVLFQESVGMHFIGSGEENTTLCFSASSELSSSTNQINFSSSAIVNETSNIEHSTTSVGSGDFRLSASSYKLAGTVYDSFTVESTSSRVDIYDAEFAITSYFQDPIDIPTIQESAFLRLLCPFSYEP